MITFSIKLRAERPRAELKRVPFISLKVPFVGRTMGHVRPYVAKKGPFVGLRRCSGFTLVELIVTVVVAAILVSLATPSFTNFIKNNRLTAQANELMADLNFARSEAIKRGANITICRSSKPFTTCSAGPWTAGWIIVGDAGQVLRVHDELGGQNTLVADANIANSFNYMRTGITDLANLGQFTLCDANSGNGRIIELAKTGRPRVSDAPGGSC